MSSDSLDVIETKFRNDVNLHLVAATLLYYDHFLTFETEVGLIWKYPNSRSSCLFFLNRYFSFIGNFVILISVFTAARCSMWNIFQELFHALAQVIVAVLLTLRIYALYGSDRRLLKILSVVVLAGTALAITTDLLASSTVFPSSIPSFGCQEVLDLRNSALVAVGWEAIFAYDLLLFGMTFRKAYQARYTHGIPGFRGMSLFSVTIRDGTIYFAIMSLFHLINVLTFYVTGDSLLRGSFSPISSCMSVTIMSRLILHLHETANQGLYANHEQTIALYGHRENYGMTFTTLWSSTHRPITTQPSEMVGPEA